MGSGSHPVEVIGRIRGHPDGKDDQSALHALPNGRTLRLRVDQGYRDFVLDGVSVAQKESLQSFYTKHVEARVKDVKGGSRCTVMMYGPTGSGKSHTMFGNSREPGVAYLALHHIMGSLEGSCTPENVRSVKANVLEIFNEEVYDLLASNCVSSPGPRSLKVMPGRARLEVRGKKVRNATSIHGTDPAKLVQEIVKVEKRRIIKSTNCNDRSSRSHCMVILDVKEVGGRLVLVDMAGSENMDQAGLGPEAKIQTGKINQGNGALKRVVEAIANGDPYIPYRDSKLTMLLQDSFEADGAKILMILCASPDSRDIHKTICTLEYGAKAKCIVRLPSSPPKETATFADGMEAVLQARLRFKDECIEKLRREYEQKEKDGEQKVEELRKREHEVVELREWVAIAERERSERTNDLNKELSLLVEQKTEQIRKLLESEVGYNPLWSTVDIDQKHLLALENVIREQQNEILLLRARAEKAENELVRLWESQKLTLHVNDAPDVSVIKSSVQSVCNLQSDVDRYTITRSRSNQMQEDVVVEIPTSFSQDTPLSNVAERKGQYIIDETDVPACSGSNQMQEDVVVETPTSISQDTPLSNVAERKGQYLKDETNVPAMGVNDSQLLSKSNAVNGKDLISHLSDSINITGEASVASEQTTTAINELSMKNLDENNIFCRIRSLIKPSSPGGDICTADNSLIEVAESHEQYVGQIGPNPSKVIKVIEQCEANEGKVCVNSGSEVVEESVTWSNIGLYRTGWLPIIPEEIDEGIAEREAFAHKQTSCGSEAANPVVNMTGVSSSIDYLRPPLRSNMHTNMSDLGDQSKKDSLLNCGLSVIKKETDVKITDSVASCKSGDVRESSYSSPLLQKQFDKSDDVASDACFKTKAPCMETVATAAARRARIENIFLLCGNHREVAALRHRSKPEFDTDNGTVLADGNESSVLSVTESHDTENASDSVELSSSHERTSDLGLYTEAMDIAGENYHGICLDDVGNLRRLYFDSPFEHFTESKGRLCDTGFTKPSAMARRQSCKHGVKRHEAVSDENTKPGDHFDTCDVYVKWESSKTLPGRLICNINMTNSSSLAKLRKEIETRLEYQHDFLFLALGELGGCPIEIEMENNTCVSSLPDFKTTQRSRLACLRPVAGHKHALTLDAVAAPFRLLDNQAEYCTPLTMQNMQLR